MSPPVPQCFTKIFAERCVFQHIHKGPVRKVNSAIYRIVILSNLETHCIKFSIFELKRDFLSLGVQYPWCHCFLCFSAAVDKSLSRDG